jgi:hypothetical protein
MASIQIVGVGEDLSRFFKPDPAPGIVAEQPTLAPIELDSRKV